MFRSFLLLIEIDLIIFTSVSFRALIYSISELIVSSYLDENIEPDIREIVKEAAQFAVELTKGVNIAYDDLQIDLTENQIIH